MSFLGALLGAYLGSPSRVEVTVPTTETQVWTWWCGQCGKKIAEYECVAWDFEDDAEMFCGECKSNSPKEGNE